MRVVEFPPVSAYDNDLGSKRPRQAAKFEIALSEDNIATEFATDNIHDLRYDHSRGKWFIWRDTHWMMDETGEALDLIRTYCANRAAGASTPAEQRRLTSVKHTKSIETFAQIDRRIAVSHASWDTDAFLIATPGGTIQLATGEMKGANPNDLITRRTAVAPSRHSWCEPWNEFLSDACNGDDEQIEFLQKMAGYALTGDTREHSLFFIYGPGGNGKSVFLNILMHIMQDYAATAPIETFTASRSEQHPTELAMLNGPRLVTSSETEEGKRWAESRIKQLTGGDPISARFMRQDFFTFKPIFKLLIVGNHMPGLNSVDDAARRRFRLVPFVHKPEKVDKLLEHRLKEYSPQIFRWAIEGCVKWRKEGMDPPSSIRITTEKYFGDMDILQQWIDERCILDENSRTDTTIAFLDWSRFATDAGEYVGKKNTLTSKLDKKNITCKPAKIDGKLSRCYFGMRLKFSPTF